MRHRVNHRSSALTSLLVPLTLASCAGPKEDVVARATADSVVASASAPDTTPPASQPPKVDPNDLAASLAFDSSTNTVTFPTVVGLTPVNNVWNFNGRAKGEMTLTVPLGARMVMPFVGYDGKVPHSFGITADSPTRIPSAPGAPVFPGAATRSYETGLKANEMDVVRFTVDKPGNYLIICGVPGHAVNGMWVRFVVSASTKTPSVK
ncbi:MAG: sulfocyanin-like copper-binding protein [Gemmatimonadaceae bacterium]